VFNESEPVVGQHVEGVGRGIVGLGTAAVATKIRHDHAVTTCGDRLSLAVAQPQRRVAGNAVEQD
jgi:hypothetical protein